ncbi:Kef-type K+ transport system, membrane component KefB [Lentzea waywayandensis]|uniref:Kef-type K+ transport system, membrane component KefB n=1 Tax=Lentzea waywayandensis TaxID=84724 RepID=A0A1I6DDY7_9PSEU|nr:cation:proton antiporter [Lentzea waywayandensis]SFR03690.1 Kef-type K+ transport system, membrane component KefB [Lentzea waywayandensis]
MALLQNALHLVALLVAFYAVAALGRLLARALRMPTVIGEIALSVLLGPVLLAAFGKSVFTAVLPPDITGALKQIGEAGLVLFLVGVVHHLDRGSGGWRGRALGRISLGAFVIPLLTGLAFAAWAVWLAPADVRGTAPTLALVIMLAVSLSVTAVPVLARILEERSDLGRASGLSMMASVLIDTPAWLLLAVALGLSAGGLGGVWLAFATIGAGALIAVAGNRVLGSAPATGFAAGRPRTTALVLALVALGAGTAVHSLGLTAIFGAFVVGVMVPKNEAWSQVVGLVSKVGRVFVPVFFVVAGATLSTSGVTAFPWVGVVLAIVLGIVGKVGGGYAGARWGGEDEVTSLRIGVLVNTRGLTEIVVLQIGFAAGLLTPGLFVALLVMALTTTALTGPALDLITRKVGAAREEVPL